SSWEAMYTKAPPDGLGTSFARDMREVAKIIYANIVGLDYSVSPTCNVMMPPEYCASAQQIRAHFFEVQNGGYDTHSSQGAGNTDDQQYGLHQEIGDALNLFYSDLENMGIAN